MEDFTEFVCFQLGVAARKIQNFYNAMFKQHGVTLGQAFVLFVLLKQEGQNIGNLAEKLMLDNSALTGLVDRMEKEGLLVRRVDPEDRRAFKIYLTQKGWDIAETIYPITYEFNQKMKQLLSKEQQNTFNLIIKNIN